MPERPNRCWDEIVLLPHEGFVKEIVCPRPQWSSKPLTHWDSEPGFPPTCNIGRQKPMCQLTKDPFPIAPMKTVAAMKSPSEAEKLRI